MSCSGGMCGIAACSGCAGNCPSQPCFDKCALRCGQIDMYRAWLFVWTAGVPVQEICSVRGGASIAGFDTNEGEVWVDLSEQAVSGGLYVPKLWDGVPVVRNAGAYLPPRDPVPVLFQATRYRPDHVVTVKVGFQLTPNIPPTTMVVAIQVDAPAQDQTYLLVGPILRSSQCASVYD